VKEYKMADFLYTIIIFPIVQIIELVYMFAFRLTHSPALALCGVSLAVSVLTLPLYFRAEKWQNIERDTQKRLKPKLDKIKAVFKGDEQYMILSTYYRQNHYHPVYTMRSAFGLLIQIPFFIAAYSYLSHIESLQGTPFLIIRDLGKPDTLLPFEINFLPILMTIINCVSGAIYTKGFPVKEKIQLYGMAAVFLVLLYNSPAGLVLYWTLNNVFSLVKNVLQKTKHVKKLLYTVIYPCIALIEVYLLFFHSGDLPNRLLAALFFALIAVVPFMAKFPAFFARKYGTRCITHDVAFSFRCFIFSSVILLTLTGFVIPSSLIASSVEEFSFIGAYNSPFPFIVHTLLQAAGIFLFWAISIYLLFEGRIRQVLSLLLTMSVFVVLINVFIATENFGFLTNTLIFSDPKTLSGNLKNYSYNACLCILASVGIFVLMLRGKRLILSAVQIITLISLVAFGISNMIKINSDFFVLEQQRMANEQTVDDTIFTLSKTGKNVLIIMLDAAVGGYVPYIFDERPDLLSPFSGFIWYSNCASFASHTLVGAPPIYGGFEYTPTAINKRDSTPLVQKHKEAYLLLPLLFSDSGYTVTVTDPPFDNYRMSNLDIFSAYPQIHAENITGKYTSRWLNKHPDLSAVDIAAILHKKMIRFSFFKTAPLVLRPFIYDDGDWLTLTDSSQEGLTETIIGDYALMDLLPALTGITESGNTYTAFYGHLPHDTAFLQAPDYIPVNTVTNFGSSHLANDSRYHVNMASFILLAKYFQFLKANDVYDNTRIILVADHGRGSSNYPNNITLPDGGRLQSYYPLLMVKDFNAAGVTDGIAIDDSFMTNADTPLIALRNIIENPVNPFTHAPLVPDKSDGIAITTIGALSSYRHSEYGYNIAPNQWLYVRDNIFDPTNWEKVEK
jgi:YidC/Oxa1 family membrane protein insertase